MDKKQCERMFEQMQPPKAVVQRLQQQNLFIVFQMITNHRSYTQQKDGCNHTAGEFLPGTADAFGWRWCSCGVQGLNRTIT